MRWNISGLARVGWAMTLFAVVSFAGACTHTDDQPGIVSIQTSETDDPFSVAINPGPILHGVVEDDSACFWIEPPGSAPLTLVWPRGYSAKTDPLRVVNAADETVATEGERPPALGGVIGDSTAECGGKKMRQAIIADVAGR